MRHPCSVAATVRWTQQLELAGCRRPQKTRFKRSLELALNDGVQRRVRNSDSACTDAAVSKSATQVR